MDTYTKVTTKWYGSRIKDSIKWIFFWLIMFIASFFVLWINEWSVDLSKIAKTSIEVDSQNINSTNDEQLISISWIINSEEEIWDNLYLKNGKFIAVSRKVEMYAWKETSKTKTEKNLWWSETTTKTYEYNKVWVNNPDNSNNFEITEWHQNPEKKLNDSTNKVINSNIWKYNIETSWITIPYNSKINLTKENTIIWNSGTWWIQLINWFLFDWKWNINSPKVWDIRISYMALNNWANVTAMWKQNNEKLDSFSDKDWNTLFRIFNWTRDDAISTLRTEFLIMLRALRLVWFLLMFIWLSLLLWPISVFLDFIPAVWWVSRFLIWTISFVVSLILSIITIIISMIFHNIFALIIAIITVWWLIYWKIKKKMDAWWINNDNKSENIKPVLNTNVEKSKEINSKPTSNNNNMIDFDTE